MKKSLINRGLIFTVIALIAQFLFTIAIFKWKMAQLEERQLRGFSKYCIDGKKHRVKDIVNVAYSIVQDYYNMSQDIDTLKERKSMELKKIIDIVSNEIKGLFEKNISIESIKEVIRKQRFGISKNYIFIIDTKGVIILHPAKPSLEGKNVINVKDKKGKYFFKEMIEIWKNQGEGLVITIGQNLVTTKPL